MFKATLYNAIVSEELQGLSPNPKASGFVNFVIPFIVSDSFKGNFCETSIHLDAKVALLSPQKHQASFSSK